MGKVLISLQRELNATLRRSFMSVPNFFSAHHGSFRQLLEQEKLLFSQQLILPVTNLLDFQSELLPLVEDNEHILFHLFFLGGKNVQHKWNFKIVTAKYYASNLIVLYTKRTHDHTGNDKIKDSSTPTVIGSSRGASISLNRRQMFPRQALQSKRSKGTSLSLFMTPAMNLCNTNTMDTFTGLLFLYQALSQFSHSYMQFYIHVKPGFKYLNQKCCYLCRNVIHTPHRDKLYIGGMGILTCFLDLILCMRPCGSAPVIQLVQVQVDSLPQWFTFRVRVGRNTSKDSKRDSLIYHTEKALSLVPTK